MRVPMRRMAAHSAIRLWGVPNPTYPKCLSMRPVKCVKVPCNSIPQCSLACHQLRLFGQLLLPSIQLRQGSGAEIAFGDLPLVVLL